jgi:hypothetical protein
VAEKASIRLPSHLARFVRPDSPAELKYQVVRSPAGITAEERATLLLFLCHDQDPEIRAAAQSAMKQLPLGLACSLVAAVDSHPRLVDLLVRNYAFSAELLRAAAQRSDLLPATADIVQKHLSMDDRRQHERPPGGVPAAAANESEVPSPDPGADPDPAAAGTEAPADPDQPEEEDEEAFRSKYQLSQTMGVGEKIKAALTGDKEWRSLLVKDSNKLVSGAVVKNPRITEPEILAICKSVIQNDEIIRVICQNKDWVKNYEIRKALVLNHKTPLAVSLRYMSFLTEKDLAALAKSKNVSSVISNQARRLLANKKKS